MDEQHKDNATSATAVVIREDTDAGIVWIDGRSINGFVTSTSCETCRQAIILNEDFDAEFCAGCNTWHAAKCGDPHCIYCSRRPSKPLYQTEKEDLGALTSESPLSADRAPVPPDSIDVHVAISRYLERQDSSAGSRPLTAFTVRDEALAHMDTERMDGAKRTVPFKHTCLTISQQPDAGALLLFTALYFGTETLEIACGRATEVALTSHLGPTSDHSFPAKLDLLRSSGAQVHDPIRIPRKAAAIWLGRDWSEDTADPLT